MQEAGNDIDRSYERVLRVGLSRDGVKVNRRFFPFKGRRAIDILRDKRPRGYFHRGIVALDTSNAVLIPQLYFDAPLAEGYLAANNMLPPEHTAVRMEYGQIVVALACPRDIVLSMESLCDTVEYRTPLAVILAEPEEGGDEVRVAVTARNIYIAVWGVEGLLFGQVYPWRTPAEALYLLDRIDGEYGFDGKKVTVTGADKKLKKALSGLYRDIIYEDHRG